MSYVTVEGRCLHYRVGGTGEPVVLIHGFGRTLEDWAPQHVLLEERFRVYSLDLPGFGESEPLSEPSTMAGLARAVVNFIDALDIGTPVHLAGNSREVPSP